MEPKLLSRDEFRESVFKRDNYKCVMCGNPAADAHHITERKLFGESGGYFIDNGASVCGSCHILCEQTTISCDTLREKCSIDKVILPEHLYRDQSYDKWGNPILSNGRRCYGELMNDESVIKILKAGGVLPLFDNRIKYPRTYHFPWSEGITSDDRVIKSLKSFEGLEVICSVKIDGENTSLMNDTVYARSRDTESHWTRDWIRSFHANIAHEIPEGWRICGENLYGKHSIHYKHLQSYFYGFGIWDKLKCLDWNETAQFFDILGLVSVPIIYKGVFNQKAISLAFEEYKKISQDEVEGYVVRPVKSFHLNEYRNVVGKFVRKNHVQTQNHWLQTNGEKNLLKE